MSVQTSDGYKELGLRLKACIGLLGFEMTIEAVEHVNHYIEHGELEMAYESLVLSCIKEGVGCDKHVSKELHSIGIDLSMETEAVFEANFWQLAREYFAHATDPYDSPPSVPGG